jgi:phosphatidylglycerol lysyltransferase
VKRRWILWLLIIGFIWLVVTRFTEIEKLAATLAGGQWEWVLAAGLVQVIYYGVFAASYSSAFDTVEVKSRVLELIPVTLGSLFVNVVTPAGGAGGVALFVDDASRRGQSPARAATGLQLQLIADFSAFTLILIFGLAYLFIQHDLKTYELITAIVLLLITVGLSGVLLLGLRWPNQLQRLLFWLQSVVNKLAAKLKRPAWLPESWAEKNAAEYIDAAVAVRRHPIRLARTIGLALAAHFLDIACLYFLFLAFGDPIPFGPLVAGYAMGILFWIVSITPQGIGVVEGVMTLVYTSLGVPAEVAATVSLAFRGLTFRLPLALGFILLSRLKSFGASERSISEGWSVRIVALLVGLMGIVNVLSAITPAAASRLAVLEQYSPLLVRRAGHLTAALAGFALLLLAGSLWRRKRVAWLLTLVVLIVSAASHLIKGLDYEEALLSLGLAVWLWFLRPQFHARSDRPSIEQGIRVLAIAFVFTLLYGVVGFYLLDRHYSVNFGLWNAVRQTTLMFTEFYDPGLVPITRFGRYFADSIYVVGAITIGYAILMLVRPVLIRELSTPEQRKQAQQIVNAYGRSSLARLILLNDKAYYFSSGGSLVAFALRGRVAVALGDPIGPEQDAANAIVGYQGYCTKNDWLPAFYQTLPDTLDLYRAAGFDTLCIGQEGVVDLLAFSLEGKAGKSLRAPLNRFTRLGYRFEIHQPPIPGELLEELRAVSDEWLVMMHGSEKRFSLGWFEDDYIRNGAVAVIRSPEGRISAFANLVPEYQLNELTIDLMRHRRETEPGTMDFLFTSLFMWAREQGYDTFNLGLSALSGVGEHSDDPAIERVMHFVYEHINQFYNFKGLHDFKEKFRPIWSPRYLIFPGAPNLAAVWMAVVEANSGDDAFPWGYLRRK